MFGGAGSEGSGEDFEDDDRQDEGEDDDRDDWHGAYFDEEGDEIEEYDYEGAQARRQYVVAVFISLMEHGH